MLTRLIIAASCLALFSSCSDMNQVKEWGSNMKETVRIKTNTVSKNSHYLSGIGEGSFRATEDPRALLEQGNWDMPTNIKGEKHIIVDLGAQKILYYVGNTMVGFSAMSSGKEGYNTPKGSYKIIQKDAKYKSNTYGVAKNKATGATVIDDFNAQKDKLPAGCYFDAAPMPYWMRITGGYGMHVGFVTGYPVSHGCIRLPEKMAKIFFENTPLGTKVTIR